MNRKNALLTQLAKVEARIADASRHAGGQLKGCLPTAMPGLTSTRGAKAKKTRRSSSRKTTPPPPASSDGSDAVPGLEFLSTLMADTPALTPDAAYYQRLLARDPSGASERIERHHTTQDPDTV